MRVAALMMVRNEVDIIATTVRHHRNAGITDFFVVDNGSTDGTAQVLADLGSEVPGLRWTIDEGPYAQSAITSELAHQAWVSGVDWVIPVDADEFWDPGPRGFSDVLAEHAEGGLEVQVHNFVQHRAVIDLAPDNLLTMSTRVHPERQLAHTSSYAVRDGTIGYVEMAYPPKWLARSAPDLTFLKGAHGIDGHEGTLAAISSITCLHAPLRARNILTSKAESGRRSALLDPDPETSWHIKRWADLEAEGRLEADWVANSYRESADGPVLDLARGTVPVIADSRLVDLVAGLLSGSGGQMGNYGHHPLA